MNSGDTTKLLLHALRRALRPVTRMLIRAGIRYEEFTDVAQSIYVESAIRDSDHHGVLPSRERIAALTRLTRHQVDYYVDNERALATAAPTLTGTLLEVLHKWHTNGDYVGPYGIALDLEFDTPSDRCFRSLVALVDPKVNPHAVLDELRRAGAIMQTGDKHFRAVSRYFMMPDPTSPNLIEHFGRTLSRLAATMEYNMDPKHAGKRLDRRVTADRGLPLEAIPAFEKHVREKSVEFLLELDNWLASHADVDADSGERVDLGVNVFFYVCPPAEEDPLAALAGNSEAKTALNS